ncbi:unnamed protein product [Angiostrongylus costaricensis]|uniref:Uncharacterized protein n=1 Tax=Angiostrongylus costaricensis TaxID=334426 RepID=A0A0R3PAI8_ANGCS|nr:unnamed protein product [Angiostrongylus costaricensis]
MWRKTVHSQWLEPCKSRNKISVGEPADGSSLKPPQNKLIVMVM